MLMLWCAGPALIADAWAASLERVEFESASQRRVPGGVLSPGDDIKGYLAKPDGAGPFPAVIVLHGCAGMHDTTRQKLADDLVAWGYVILLVDSYATRRIDNVCILLRVFDPSTQRFSAEGVLNQDHAYCFVANRGPCLKCTFCMTRMFIKPGEFEFELLMLKRHIGELKHRC